MRLKILILLFLSIITTQDVAARKWFKNIKLNNIEYRLSYIDHTAMVDDGTDASGTVTIPEFIEYKGEKFLVNKIGAYAFHVDFPDKNGEIYQKSLNLKSLALPNSIRKIGQDAFRGCKNLQKINLPDSLKVIEAGTFQGCKSLKEIDLPPKLRKIEGYAFSGCGLVNISIPNTVDTIGLRAFISCKSLAHIIVPNNPYKRISAEYNWEIGEIFHFCSSIEDVQGHSSLPEYIFEELPEDCPFIKEKLPKIRSSFSRFAYDKIKSHMEEWQKKKEYETTGQWKERVTEANRQEQLTKVIDNVRKEYISQKTPKVLIGNLGMFDADYGVYPVNANGVNNTFYAQVPLSEAHAFKENWNKVVMQPTYGVVDDQLGILSCTFKLGNKTYQSTRNYSNDNDEDMAITLPPLEINLGVEEKDKSEHKIIQVDNSIDLQIPVTNATNANTFAVIIGNENYQRVSKVEYALNDAKIFAQYCQRTLGLPQKNIRSYTDATYGTMITALDDIFQIAKAYNGNINVIFYYAGHGVPDESTRNAFLLPVDVDGSKTNLCLSVGNLYSKLNALNACQVTVFMDACFSGSQRGEGMLASARGVALKVKNDTPQGNMVVFSAATGDQTAFPFKEKGHGMFTYFLLKKLRDTRGDVTLGDIANYVIEQVSQQSVVENGKSQTPTLVSSSSLVGKWESIKLK